MRGGDYDVRFTGMVSVVDVQRSRGFGVVVHVHCVVLVRLSLRK
jgi:hypothetical protein